jgi:hypothetical protein
MPKAPSPEKQQVEIEKKPQTPQEQIAAELLKRLEKPVQPPPIEETLEKAEQAITQAAKAKTKTRKTWYCSECGKAHIQLYLDSDGSESGRGHFDVVEEDGEPIHTDGTALNAKQTQSANVGRTRGGGSDRSRNRYIF